MNEIELLKKLVDLESTIHRLSIKVKYSNDEELENSINDLEKQKDDIILTLDNIEDTSYSKRAKSSIINQINAYVTEISKAQPGLNLIRNQSLIIENYLFSRILNDVNRFLTDEVYTYYIPCNLYYTYSKENSIEVEDLKGFLNNELKILNNIDKVNFISLRSYYNDFENRIIDKYIRID